MALPSQTERSTQHRPVMTQPGRKGINKPAAIAVVILLAAGAVYGIYRFFPDKPDTTPGGEPNKKLAQTPANRTPTNEGPKPAPKSLIDNKPVEPAPVTINQASGSNGAGGPAPGTLGNALGAAPEKQNDPSRPAPVDVTSPDLQPKPSDGGTTPAIPGSAGTTPPTTPAQPIVNSNSPAGVRSLIETGEREFASGKLLEARTHFAKAYLDKDCGPGDQSSIRERLTAINNDLLFSPKVTPGDPLVEQYTVQAGDVLERIRRKKELAVDWRFIARVNGMANPDNLKVGQKIKLPRGPFHAIVHKSDFRADVFAGSPDEPERWVYLRSFKVGLGEAQKSDTPTGTFKIRNKMKNPAWKNPKTGESFTADDPKNPIGEFWLGWEGLGDSKVYTGFGLHGTIDPSSIGQQKSMGCVRLANGDIDVIYEMLIEQVSVVKVVP